MKKGDTIQRTALLPAGTIVLRNPTSQEMARSFMETDFLAQYGAIPTWEIHTEEATGQQAVFLTSPISQVETAIVQWLIDDEVAIKQANTTYRIFRLADEPDWVVILESSPSYQSSVENLSDEDLRRSIDNLRSQRTCASPPRTKKVATPTEKVNKSDPLSIFLDSLTEEKRLSMMKKLGMMD